MAAQTGEERDARAVVERVVEVAPDLGMRVDRSERRCVVVAPRAQAQPLGQQHVPACHDE
jgi:hypothetical protein